MRDRLIPYRIEKLVTDWWDDLEDFNAGIIFTATQHGSYGVYIPRIIQERFGKPALPEEEDTALRDIVHRLVRLGELGYTDSTYGGVYREHSMEERPYQHIPSEQLQGRMKSEARVEFETKLPLIQRTMIRYPDATLDQLRENHQIVNGLSAEAFNTLKQEEVRIRHQFVGADATERMDIDNDATYPHSSGEAFPEQTVITQPSSRRRTERRAEVELDLVSTAEEGIALIRQNPGMSRQNLFRRLGVDIGDKETVGSVLNQIQSHLADQDEELVAWKPQTQTKSNKSKRYQIQSKAADDEQQSQPNKSTWRLDQYNKTVICGQRNCSLEGRQLQVVEGLGNGERPLPSLAESAGLTQSEAKEVLEELRKDFPGLIHVERKDRKSKKIYSVNKMQAETKS